MLIITLRDYTRVSDNRLWRLLLSWRGGWPTPWVLARQRVNAVITLTSACQRRKRRANAGSALLALVRHWHRGSHTVKALPK